MDSLVDRLQRSIAQRGYWGTIQICIVSLLWLILPRFRRREAQRERLDAEFDWKYGVDTGGVFRPRADQVTGKHWAFGGNYQAVEPSSFLEALSGLDLCFDDFTFLDFGSGKGRTLLLASLFPFKRVVGVEYCSELNEIARRNAFHFHPPERRCSRIDVVDADAADFEIPNDPLVLFLFHPFAAQVMSKVVKNVADSFMASPRRIVVIYITPNFADLWEATGLFQRTQRSPAVFDTAPDLRASRKELAGAITAGPALLLQAGLSLVWRAGFDQPCSAWHYALT